MTTVMIAITSECMSEVMRDIIEQGFIIIIL